MAEEEGAVPPPAVSVNSLQFGYPGQGVFISKFTLELQAGSRCLLIGANGAGKTTLLRIMAGKHMVGGRDVVRILGRSAFHDTKLTCDGTLAYLGGSWNRSVSSAGEVPLQGDFSAEHMIFGVKDVDPGRRDRLIELLDIDLAWRMHKVSDGQRRRVQICMGLLHPFQVLLLDEITVDLDVVARMDLLSFFVSECTQDSSQLRRWRSLTSLHTPSRLERLKKLPAWRWTLGIIIQRTRNPGKPPLLAWPFYSVSVEMLVPESRLSAFK